MMAHCMGLYWVQSALVILNNVLYSYHTWKIRQVKTMLPSPECVILLGLLEGAAPYHGVYKKL